MPMTLPRFRPASDRSVLVYLGDRISLETHHRVRKLLHMLESQPIPGVHNLHPAYCSILLDFDPIKLTHSDLETILADYLGRIANIPIPEPHKVEIPTCYGGEFGPDLADIAELHSLTSSQVIEFHTSVTYVVYFLGFVPGFAYLGELPEALATPRLGVPRRGTPVGSVGIAERQTAIYPLSTPGGWRVIGRTPVQMFRTDRSGMSFLSIGDLVRFTPISPNQFAALQQP